MEPVLTLYLAGPMRGYQEFNFPAFLAVAGILREDGHTILSPAERDLEAGFDPVGMEGTDEELLTHSFDLHNAMRHDFEWILNHADGIALLPGWRDSSGARAEVLLAQLTGKLVFEYHDDGLHEIEPDIRTASFS